MSILSTKPKVVAIRRHVIVDAMNYIMNCINLIQHDSDGQLLSTDCLSKCQIMDNLDNSVSKRISTWKNVQRESLDKLMEHFLAKRAVKPVHMHLCAKYQNEDQLNFWKEVHADYTKQYGAKYFTVYALPVVFASAKKNSNASTSTVAEFPSQRRSSYSKLPVPKYSRAFSTAFNTSVSHHPKLGADDFLVLALYNYLTSRNQKKKTSPLLPKPSHRPAQRMSSGEWKNQKKKKRKPRPPINEGSGRGSHVSISKKVPPHKFSPLTGKNAQIEVSVISMDQYRDASDVLKYYAPLVNSRQALVALAPEKHAKYIYSFAKTYMNHPDARIPTGTNCFLRYNQGSL